MKGSSMVKSEKASLASTGASASRRRLGVKVEPDHELVAKLEELPDPATYLDDMELSADEELACSVDRLLGSISSAARELALFDPTEEEPPAAAAKNWTKMGDKRFMSRGHEQSLRAEQPQTKRISSVNRELVSTHSGATDSGPCSQAAPSSWGPLSLEPLTRDSVETPDFLDEYTAAERRMYRSTVLASRRASRVTRRSSSTSARVEHFAQIESKADLKQRRNREAAHKSRQDRLEKMKALEQRNAELEHEVESLRLENQRLRRRLGME